MVIDEYIFIWAFLIVAILGLPLALWFSFKDEPSFKKARENYFNGPLMPEDEAILKKESILNRLFHSFAVAFSLGGIMHNIPTLYLVGLVGWLPVLIFSPNLRSIVDIVTYIIMHALAIALVIGLSLWVSETPLQLLANQFTGLGVGAVTVIAVAIKYRLGHFRANLPSSPPL